MTRRWDHLEAAQRYASAGWPVFPLIPGEKVPATSRGFLDATTDQREIERLWRNPDRNVGIATGAPGPDVLDVDRHADGSGFASLNKLIRAGLVPEAGALIRTPNDGIRAYYKGTDQRSGSLPEHHMDFKAAGGYVVAPPSTVRARIPPWIGTRQQKLADRAHASGDEFAAAHGWIVTANAGWLGFDAPPTAIRGSTAGEGRSNTMTTQLAEPLMPFDLAPRPRSPGLRARLHPGHTTVTQRPSRSSWSAPRCPNCREAQCGRLTTAGCGGWTCPLTLARPAGQEPDTCLAGHGTQEART